MRIGSFSNKWGGKFIVGKFIEKPNKEARLNKYIAKYIANDSSLKINISINISR